MKKCPYCAEPVQKEAIKCRYCGEWFKAESPKSLPKNEQIQQLRPAQKSPDSGGDKQPIPPEKSLEMEELLETYIGKRTEKYLPPFRRFRQWETDDFSWKNLLTKDMTWHWPACLAGSWWFLYRKLYAWAIFDFFVTLIPIVGLIPRLIFGLLGYYLVFKKARASIASVTRSLDGFDDASTLKTAIQRKGGVNSWVPKVAIPLMSIIVISGISAAIVIPQLYGKPSKVTDAILTESTLGKSDPERAMSPEERRIVELHKAASQGDAEAQFNLGSSYYFGNGVIKDGVKAVEWYERAAKQGIADAQYNLAQLYSTGEFVPKDPVKALEWFRKAAAQGHARAQNNIGAAYEQGDGVPQDHVRAVEWYEKAATLGLAKAQYNLGLIYSLGVLKDDFKSAEWFEKAANQGFAEAQYSLGRAYLLGNGVAKDTRKAKELWEKAAAQDVAEAKSNLGFMYALGEGVPKDPVKAVEWFTKAAAQGLAEAQNNLGASYEHGKGIAKDLILAYAWFNLAAARGSKSAEKARDRLESEITTADRAEGQRLASNWRPGTILLR